MYQYKVKYIVVVEDENGNYIENAFDEYFDTEAEALEFIKGMDEE